MDFEYTHWPEMVRFAARKRNLRDRPVKINHPES